ncbi:hypothetical protein [Sinosporangium siamense]|nr:hypothetical protein [Sinosporangium siamense]
MEQVLPDLGGLIVGQNPARLGPAGDHRSRRHRDRAEAGGTTLPWPR